METLYELSLSAVSSKYNTPFRINDAYLKEVAYLPQEVIQELLLYLSPHSLMQLHPVLETVGASVNKIWEYHCSKRWQYKFQKEPVIFQLFKEDGTEDYHNIYLNKHFSDVLRRKSFAVISLNAMSAGVNCMLTSRKYHEKKKRCVVGHNSSVFVKEFTTLEKYLPFATNISLHGKQFKYVLAGSILGSFKKSVRRLNIFALRSEYFEDLTILLSHLIYDGCLEELDIFFAEISYKQLYCLLHLCAGHLKSVLNYSHDVPKNEIFETFDELFHSETMQEGKSWSDKLLSENDVNIKDDDDLLPVDDCDSICEEDSEAESSSSCSISLFDEALQTVTHSTAEATHTAFKLVADKSEHVNRSVCLPECVFHSGAPLSDFSPGLKAFSIISSNQVDSSFTQIYQGILPLWPSLEAIYLSRVDLSNLSFASIIARCTGKPWKLKEIVVDDSEMNCSSLLDCLLDIVNCETREEPMHRFKFLDVEVTGACDSDHSFCKKFPKECHAFRSFELCSVALYCDSAQNFITNLLTSDKALRNLTIKNIVPGLLSKWLQSFNGQCLNSVLLSSLHLINPEMESQLCRVLKTMVRVQHLSLSESRLNPEFLISEQFLDCLTNMTALHHFDVSHCSIGNAVAKFLERLLRKLKDKTSCHLRSVDVSYTACSEKCLEEVAGMTIQEDLQMYGSVVKHLAELNLSGNKFTNPKFPEVTRWIKLVGKLKATIDFCSMPSADYIAMM